MCFFDSCCCGSAIFFFFFFNDTATTEIYTLSYTTLFRSLRSCFSEEEYFVCVWNAHPSAAETELRAYLVMIQWTFDERSEEHTSELQSRLHLVCRLLLEKKRNYQHSCSSLH